MDEDGGWLLAVHVGAGHYGSTNEVAYLALMREALHSGRTVTQAQTQSSAAQVAVHMLSVFERSEFTNAGRGANLTEQGHVECEASVACGRTRLVGACAAVRGVQQPSALALSLVEQASSAEDTTLAGFEFGRQPPLVVVGEHARRAARQFGLETASDAALESYQVTPRSEKQWHKWHRRFQAAEDKLKAPEELLLDTVGAVCMDPEGNVAAAVSSGGIAYKVPGRVGLAGCPRMGCDAANATEKLHKHSRKRKRQQEQKKTKNAFAVACTGRGEHFVRSNLVASLTRRLRKSVRLEPAFRKAFAEAKEDNGGHGVEGGVLALVAAPSSSMGDEEAHRNCSSVGGVGKRRQRRRRRQVQIGAAFSTPCMGVGFLQTQGVAEPQVQLLRRPTKSVKQCNDGRQSDTRDQLAIHVSFLDV